MSDWPGWIDLVDTGPWYRNRGIVLVNLCVGLALLTSYTNGFDGSMTNGLQMVQQWQTFFHNPTGNTLGLLTSVQNIAGFIALPFAPYVTDGLGRRKGIFIGGVIMLGGVAFQAVSANVAQFIVARGLIGFGMAFSINAAPLLVTELAYPTQRGPITAMYNTTWYLGSIISAWTTFGTFRIHGGGGWSWRIPSILQALPSILQCCLIWFVPESPRWLISKGRDEEAKEVLGKYHGNGNIYHPLVDHELSEIKEALSLEEEMGNVTWRSLFATSGNRRRMRIVIALGLFSQWSGNVLVSYYLNLILETVGIKATATKTLINGLLQIFNFIVAITSAMFIERIGRRKLFLASNAGMLLAFVVWTIFAALFQETQSVIMGKLTIVMIFVYFGFYDIAYTPLLVAYCIEIMPFRMRAKGFAAMSFTVTLALIFNQYVNPVALDRIGWHYYLFYVGWLAFELVFIFTYLWETKGRTLEQTAALFDGGMTKDPFVYAQEIPIGVQRRQSNKLGSDSGHVVRPRTGESARTHTTGSTEMWEMKTPYDWEIRGPETARVRDVRF